jgi:hypothetical protein
MAKVPIRTLTYGLAESHPIPTEALERAARTLLTMKQECEDAGHEVQTLRLSARPAFHVVPADKLLEYGRELQRVVDDLGVIHGCSLGPALFGAPFELIPDLLAECQSLNCTIRLAEPGRGVDTAFALPTARVMLRLSAGTDEGLGNFRFAATARMGAGSPFFPAAYHSGPASVSVGLQSAGVVAESLADVTELDHITGHVRAALRDAATPVVELIKRLAREERVNFGGIDTSPAPAGDDSIGAALEVFGPFGSPGTLAAAAAVTAAIKGTGLPTCGYSGLMLPVLEDTVLARRWAEGAFNLHDLLAYSSVCGTGLDTVPIPGDADENTVAALLLDVATLAVRLDKPLSARLFPVPGAVAGDATGFTSPYLVNSVVRW